MLSNLFFHILWERWVKETVANVYFHVPYMDMFFDCTKFGFFDQMTLESLFMLILYFPIKDFSS